MDKFDEILRALGQLEGKVDTFCKMSERVSNLERWQAWLTGGWAALAAAYAYLCKGAHWK